MSTNFIATFTGSPEKLMDIYSKLLLNYRFNNKTSYRKYHKTQKILMCVKAYLLQNDVKCDKRINLLNI